ncbi:hypothetical protein PR048_028837, partial [Dryococelus australis]
MPSCQITRFTGRHFGRLMSEYIVANIFNWERDFRRIIECQSNCVWGKDQKIIEYRSICDLSFGIVGLGAIGKQVSKTLKFFGGTVWAVVRNVPEPNQRCPHVDKYSTFRGEYQNKKMLSAEVADEQSYVNVKSSFTPVDLQFCSKKKSVFMNVGRGNVISEGDIIAAIENKWISGAILDVFEVEPLPADSRLWKRPELELELSWAREELLARLRWNQGLMSLSGSHDPGG